MVLLVGLERTAKARKVNVYLSGITVDSDARSFTNSLSGSTEATARNWYLDDWFCEGKLTKPAHIGTATIIVAAFVCAIVLILL